MFRLHRGSSRNCGKYVKTVSSKYRRRINSSRRRRREEIENRSRFRNRAAPVVGLEFDRTWLNPRRTALFRTSWDEPNRCFDAMQLAMNNKQETRDGSEPREIRLSRSVFAKIVVKS